MAGGARFAHFRAPALISPFLVRRCRFSSRAPARSTGATARHSAKGGAPKTAVGFVEAIVTWGGTKPAGIDPWMTGRRSTGSRAINAWRMAPAVADQDHQSTAPRRFRDRELDIRRRDHREAVRHHDVGFVETKKIAILTFIAVRGVDSGPCRSH
jgi:hypothetical protein